MSQTTTAAYQEMLRRAFRASDPDGDAALNLLLYGAGALLASAVLLVTTAPAVLGVVLAMIPWLALAVGTGVWLKPEWEGQIVVDRQIRSHAERVRAAAADLLLDEVATEADRRLAAAYLTDSLDSEERARAAERILGLGARAEH